jgi:hypothetical protein
MSKESKKKLVEIDLADLDEVTGAKAGAVFSVNGQAGIFGGSIQYSPGNGVFVSGGLGKAGFGADASFGIVTPTPGHTVSDVLTGNSFGGAAYYGGGVRGDVSVNPTTGEVSGAVFQAGLGFGGSGGGGTYGYHVGDPISGNAPNQLPTDFHGMNLQQGYDNIQQLEASQPYYGGPTQSGQYFHDAQQYVQNQNALDNYNSQQETYNATSGSYNQPAQWPDGTPATPTATTPWPDGSTATPGGATNGGNDLAQQAGINDIGSNVGTQPTTGGTDYTPTGVDPAQTTNDGSYQVASADGGGDGGGFDGGGDGGDGG